MKLNIHHCTSEPFAFFGRQMELALLDRALAGDQPSVVAFVGPGGQGKTAILRHWLDQLARGGWRPVGAAEHVPATLDGVFFWSFYRGKDSDLCLRALYSALMGVDHAGNVSASYCVDRALPLLRSQRWAVLLDGTEVVQHETGPWFGRFLHPELGRLLEELASAPQPGVAVLTTRFALPDLQRRPHAHIVQLTTMPPADARALLLSLGVRGSEAELDAAAAAAGRHAKAVELLATWLVRFHEGLAANHRVLPDIVSLAGASEEERHVLRVLQGHRFALPQETQDILALATAFRDPPTEACLLQYLASAPARVLLHQSWGRNYLPFADRPDGWLVSQLDELVCLRLLERVALADVGHQSLDGDNRRVPAPSVPPSTTVLDAHPLVRRGFEHVLGTSGRRQTAEARAGFLSGRPDRQRAATLDEAREEVELFHAYCDAGLWAEADQSLAALDMPRYRFLAPAFERDLLLRFFPEADRRRPPLWPGFGRRRSLAVCLEMLGQFEQALETYSPQDAPLCGDALIALGRLEPLLVEGRTPHPWEMLWQAYRAHALCLVCRLPEALALCRRLVPRDVYEWTHVLECLLRAGELSALDMNSFLYRPPREAGSRWDDLARQRMRADHQRLTSDDSLPSLGPVYQAVIEGYDQGGLPWERVLTRLSHARWLLAQKNPLGAAAVNAIALDVASRFGMRVLEADAWRLEADIARLQCSPERAAQADAAADRLRAETGYRGPERP